MTYPGTLNGIDFVATFTVTVGGKIQIQKLETGGGDTPDFTSEERAQIRKQIREDGKNRSLSDYTDNFKATMMGE